MTTSINYLYCENCICLLRIIQTVKSPLLRCLTLTLATLTKMFTFVLDMWLHFLWMQISLSQQVFQWVNQLATLQNPTLSDYKPNCKRKMKNRRYTCWNNKFILKTFYIVFLTGSLLMKKLKKLFFLWHTPFFLVDWSPHVHVLTLH